MTDRYGNHKPEWTDYYSCRAYAITYIHDETETATISDERTITFEVRYCSELVNITSIGFRVIFHDAVYDIDSVDMMNWKRKTVKLKCRKESKP